jgi:hypothetical protein
VSFVEYAKAGKLVLGAPISADDKFMTSTDTSHENFLDKSIPLAGDEGLRNLISKGVLRKATSRDLALWRKQSPDKEKNDSQSVVDEAGTNMDVPQSVHNGYVILREMTIPAGLYGAHAATFFLLHGVPYPKGKLGHSKLYDFNTLTCHGVTCGRF